MKTHEEIYKLLTKLIGYAIIFISDFRRLDYDKTYNYVEVHR